MLIIYRRHGTHCPLRAQEEQANIVGADLCLRSPNVKPKCRCPFWVDGVFGGHEVRRSLKTRDQGTAIETVRAWKLPVSEREKKVDPPSIHQVCQKFIADAEARRLAGCTVKKYRLLFRRIEEFGERHGLRFITELDLSMLDQFRSDWKLGPRSSLKQLERLRAFFKFCLRRKWIAENPAIDLKPPKIQQCPTMPFTQVEMGRIFAAIPEYARTAGTANAQRLHAFVLILRYSGMRIGDAVKVSADRLVADKIFLYTQKTGVPVNGVVPDFVALELEKAPKSSEGHFFWTGKSKLHSAIGKWQRRLKRLFQIAKVEKGHAHRFRDTFAVELLLGGTPIERVSVLLGHSSIKITERHYNPWVRSRQEQLESDLRAAWERDPMVQMQKAGEFGNPKGTNQVQEKMKPN
jgi:integrase/recombinase XerD